ncbi:alpha/beta hydrolase [Rhodococcus gannanensis]|uniref:Alpha/beta fold hydrolase n=1 Tax=Rhodococcus gannanensis TaxID=1960308 RepID=A0ABW4P9C9_9NOCA
MTVTLSDRVTSAPIATVPSRRVVDVDGIPMSALVAEAAEPVAVILALHGGATDSRYFDCPGHPRHSLLRLAATLGYTVIALDRPGYGASAEHGDEVAPADRRVDLGFGAVERLLDGRDVGAGVFVWSHSAGSELATRIAAGRRGIGGRKLLGLELSGTGLEYQPSVPSALGTSARDSPSDLVRELLWTPEHLYPGELVGGAPIRSATPAYEPTVVAQWPRRTFRATAAEVRIPVRFTAAEHEKVWRADPPALEEIRSMFTAAPRVEMHTQLGGGHNLSLGHAAPAYHLDVLAFVEECIAGRDRATGTDAPNSFRREGN